MLKLLSLGFFLALAGLANAESDTPKLAPEVEFVVSGGHWQSGDQEGRYRVLVINSGWEHVHSKVFLQWISTGTQEQQDPSILFSVPIQEINESPVWSVGVPEFPHDTEQIKLRATNSRNLKEQLLFNITPQAGGKYQIKEGTK